MWTVLLRRVGSRSTFILLLLNTLVSTSVVALVSISALQRVADEHPRRYLSKHLFNYLAEVHTADKLNGLTVGEARLKVFSLDSLPANSAIPFEQLLRGIEDDPDGVAITTAGDRYVAATRHGDTLVVLPAFGRPLSSQAIVLVGIVAATILLVLIANFFSIRHLTAPFSVFERVVKSVDAGNLSDRVPLRKTYGEFHHLANSFNGMLARLDHVNTARKHMLLAIPHEVRTPLARLKVRKDLIQDAQLRDQIAGDIDILEELLDTILETERMQTNEGRIVREEIPIRIFFEEFVEEYHQQYEDLSLRLKTTCEEFYADGFCVRIMLKNLVSNAIRYGRGRPIVIEVAETSDPPDTLVISVIDEGIGIPADQIPYVMEPFWRLDESRQRSSGGYGLGLYLCRTIAQGHDGDISVESAVDVGTTVTVTLPGALAPNRNRGQDNDV